MAKAKKKMGWDFDGADDAAKSSIEKIEKIIPKKPKKKMGRPRATEEPTTRILVTERTRDLAKIAATMERTTMLEYIEQLVKADCENRGIKVS